MVFPNRRGRESAARAGILWNLFAGQVMNRLFIREKDYVFKRSTDLGFKGNHAL